MNQFFSKTFGGLSKEYYFRQLFFGCLLGAFFFFTISAGGSFIRIDYIAMLVINTLLYPYSRFVYETIMGFIFGNNIFIVNAIFMLVVKLITMYLCWVLAIFVAPIGLVYIYIYSSNRESEENNVNEQDSTS